MLGVPGSTPQFREKEEKGKREDSNCRSILNSRAGQVLPALLAFASSERGKR